MGNQPIINYKLPITNPVALLTGASRSPGPTLARTLAGQGWRVALNDLNPIALDEIAGQITQAGGQARAYVADIAQKLALQTILNDIEDEWKNIGVLINNTHIMPTMPLLDMDEWDWRRTLDVNLTGAFLLTQVVGRMMRAQGGGIIIHLLKSDEGVGHAAYAATQAGLQSLVRVAERELGEAGVQVCTVQLDNRSGDEIMQEISHILKQVM